MRHQPGSNANTPPSAQPVRSLQIRTFALCMTAAGLFGGCATGGEVVVVDAPPRTSQPATDAAVESPPPATIRNGADERLRIAEGHPIRSLDPLFAQTPAELRAVGLLYESLFKIAPDGRVEPALVREWTLSDDSLTYTFELREDRFFHDSPIFANGRGKRVSSVDVRLMILRAANPNVPGNAANLLRGIDGFELFASEQSQVKQPALRVTRSVEGVRIAGPSTLRIQLEQPDTAFIRKLASPWLSIYPREAFLNGSAELHERPVGTGAYSLTSHSDSLTVLDAVGGPASDPNREPASWRRVEFVRLQIPLPSPGRFEQEAIDWIPEIEAWGFAADGGNADSLGRFGLTPHGGTFEAELFENSLTGESDGNIRLDTVRVPVTDDPRIRMWIRNHFRSNESDGEWPEGCRELTEQADAGGTLDGSSSASATGNPEDEEGRSAVVFTEFHGPVLGIDYWSVRIDPFHSPWVSETGSDSLVHAKPGGLNHAAPLARIRCSVNGAIGISPELPLDWSPAAPWHIPFRVVSAPSGNGASRTMPDS